MFKSAVEYRYKSVLYLDEDSNEKAQVEKLLVNLFHRVFSSSDNIDAMSIYEKNSPDIVITSCIANNIDGLEFIKKLRHYDYHLPIIVLSPLYNQSAVLSILNQSIDAYLCKPLNIMEFKNALYKSVKRIFNYDEFFKLDEHLIFDNSTQELILDGIPVTLGVKERKLLLLLIEKRFKTVTKEEIISRLSDIDPLSESAIKKLVLRLRKKMASNLIVSIRGVGYKLQTKEVNTIFKPANLIMNTQSLLQRKQ